ARSLMQRDRFDAIYITTYPIYPALLGPRLKASFRVPFVLDVQDPWVGSWGDSVGPRADGSPDFKSRASRQLACALERWIVPTADGVTAVSQGTFDEISERLNGEAKTLPFLELPIGGDARDFERLTSIGATNRIFNRADGCMHVCSVGTVLPR